MTNKFLKSFVKFIKGLFADTNYKVIVADKEGIILKKGYNSLKASMLAANECVKKLDHIEYGMIVHNSTGEIKHYITK